MITKTFHPTNIGYLPTGVNGVAQVSTFIVGRTNTGSFEGAGFGAGGRPDPLQVVEINLISPNDGFPFQKGTVVMNVEDLMNIAGGPSRYFMSFKEVTVCESGVTKKMVILASQTYT